MLAPEVERAIQDGRRFGHCSSSPKASIVSKPSVVVRITSEAKPDSQPMLISNVHSAVTVSVTAMRWMRGPRGL